MVRLCGADKVPEVFVVHGFVDETVYDVADLARQTLMKAFCKLKQPLYVSSKSFPSVISRASLLVVRPLIASFQRAFVDPIVDMGATLCLLVCDSDA